MKGGYGRRQRTIETQNRQIRTKTSRHINTMEEPLSNSITTEPCQKNRYIKNPMNKLQPANRVTQQILSLRGEMWQSNRGYYTGYLLGAGQLRRVARRGVGRGS